MIHIAYALSDPRGTYSKFAGASICSVLENTAEQVTFHLLHDGSLSEENRRRFAGLAESCGSRVHFCDVPSLLPRLLEQGRELLPEALASERYTGANVYRLLLAEALPELERVIFLDADTIVNLDIARLWETELGEAPLAAVPDYEVLEHFGQSHKIRPSGSFLYREGLTDVRGIFNAGVLLLNLKLLRRGESLLLAGLKFLRRHGGQWEFFDNDILIGFFAKSYLHLPWQYHLRVGWALAYGENRAEEAIYHYVDRNYSLNEGIALHALFLRYLAQSPWGGAAGLCACSRAAAALTGERLQARLRAMRLIWNAARGKRRVLMGLREDEARLRSDFRLGPEEAFLPLAPGGAVALPHSVSTHFYLIFWQNYGEVKSLLEGAGLSEYVHFADGRLLMPEWLGDAVPEDREIIRNM